MDAALFDSLSDAELDEYLVAMDHLNDGLCRAIRLFLLEIHSQKVVDTIAAVFQSVGWKVGAQRTQFVPTYVNFVFVPDMVKAG